METTYSLDDHSWLDNFLFLLKFRIKQKLRNLFIRGNVAGLNSSERHNVRVIRRVGKRVLCECQNCREQAIVLDKIEAKGYFSRIECLIKGGDDQWTNK